MVNLSKSAKVVLCSVFIGSLLSGCTPTSSSGSSSSNSTTTKQTTCQFKEGGKLVCSKAAMSGGNFCSTHQKYLDDIYNSVTGG